MPTLKIRKDVDEGVVEVDTGDGWRKFKPQAARDLAATYEKSIEEGEMDDAAGVQQFITRLRRYADDLED